MVWLFANSEYPDQTWHFVASDLGLHCLLITRLGVSRLQWVNPFMSSGLFYHNSLEWFISNSRMSG